MSDQRRQIILTNLNPSVYTRRYISSFLSELLVNALLYDEVLIREDDLIVNEPLSEYLADERKRQIFEEFLRTGAVRLLRLGKGAYGRDIRRDPVREPVSARAEEHERRRSYKGRPWRATPTQWQLFRSLDRIVTDCGQISTRVQKPFPRSNTFAAELEEILTHRAEYRLRERVAFEDIDDRMADAFVQFCSAPGAWVRFLVDHGRENPLLGVGRVRFP